MSTSATTKQRRAQGYESSPPRCANCQRFEPPKHGVPGPGHPRHYYIPPRCKLGGFKVKVQAICDAWIGKDGSTLEGMS